jgi:hypothetical protein
MNEQDKYIEEQTFRIFRERCPGFPDGDVTDNTDDTKFSGGPDFMVSTSTVVLGIETTRLCLDGDKRDNSRTAKEGSWDKIVDAAEKRWKGKGHAPVDVAVTFQGTATYCKGCVETLAEKLVTLVEKHLPAPGEIRCLPDRDVDCCDWPETVVSVRIFHAPSEYDPGWSVHDAAWLPELKPQMIQDVMDHKAKKLPAYRKHCSTTWLVIGATTAGLSSYFRSTDQVSGHVFTSGFDRVFLQELAGNRPPYELKVKGNKT